MKTKIVILLAAIAGALSIPATANSYAYFDWAWGYPYVNEFHQNRWYWSDTVMPRESAYVKLDRCLPSNARLKLGYVSPTGWQHRIVNSAFGACSLQNPWPSHGAAHVQFRIEYWNCVGDWNIWTDGCARTTVQGDYYWNNPLQPAPPGGYKWYRLAEGWAYSWIGGCNPACQ